MILDDLSSEAFSCASMALSGVDEDWARHVESIGPCRLEAKPAREPYEALIRAVAYQQLHAKAGDAILARFLAQFPDSQFPQAAAVLGTDETALRGCGFSVSKVATIRGIARAALDGIVPTRAEAVELSNDALIGRLVGIRGIGRWTVEMFLIYTLNRSDVLPIDDFGVRDGYRRLKGLDVMPTPRQMREIGEAWKPHRTVAAWYLWRSTRST
jgi:DNA-3-methyladenine glycosylase II